MWCGVSALNQEESDMNATAALPVVGVDLAKSVFQLAIADHAWRAVEQQRFTRTQFERWFANRAVGLVVMEACGSAHHWARWLNTLGIEVRLLPAAYIRAYVKRNKTDAADACALLEAARCADITPVKIKSIEQQALQGLHRTRSLWMAGVGLLTATAMVAATSGEVSHFRDARHFASWFGLTPKEHSSGGTRHLGRISKRSDRYLRMLLTHGARSVLRAASVAVRAGKPVDSLRQWALAVQGRANHNKAACALANKLARICYATLRDGERYGSSRRLTKKIERTAFALPT